MSRDEALLERYGLLDEVRGGTDTESLFARMLHQMLQDPDLDRLDLSYERIGADPILGCRIYTAKNVAQRNATLSEQSLRQKARRFVTFFEELRPPVKGSFRFSVSAYRSGQTKAFQKAHFLEHV